MSTFDAFDELDEAGVRNKNDRAFYRLPYNQSDEKSEAEVHKWLMAELDYLKDANKSRFKELEKNLALNKGIMYKDQDKSTGDSYNRDTTDAKKMVGKLVLNVLREMNRVRASRILKYKPAFAVLPTNDELSDKIAADMCEKLVSHIWYEQRFDGELLPSVIDGKGPLGEMFLFIEWNPELGDLNQEYKKAQEYAKKENLEKIPLLNDEGKPETDEQGRPIYIEKAIKNGDVQYKVYMPFDFLYERHPSGRYENARYGFRRDVYHVDDARLMFPKKTKFIKGDRNAKLYDYQEMKTFSNENFVEVWTFFHKKTDNVKDGREISFTKDGLLENTKGKYSHDRLPCVRWIDLENPGEPSGVSFFDDVKGVVGAFNNLTNMILKNELLVGHPKWMMPDGAANIKDLGNAATVVKFKGPRPPALVQANPTGQGAYNLREMLKEEAFRMADVSRTGNGTPPQGITAAVALQYLSELEAERWNSPVLKHNEAILQTVIMTLAVCGDYYDASDKRMIRIQGEDGEWMSEFFNTTYLAKDYDVRIQSSSALPESKAARLESLLFMAEKFPDRVDPDQVLEMFEFAQSKKFIKEGTISIRAAEAENEMIVTGKELVEPMPYEDQITHWKTHLKKMREWSYKNRATKEVKDRMEKHVMVHEMYMVRMAVKNPEFAQVLATLQGFPMFFKPTSETQDVETPAAEDMGIPPEVQSLGEAQMPPPQPEEVAQQGTPVQQPGQDVDPSLPPVDQQLGLEQSNQDPTNSI